MKCATVKFLFKSLIPCALLAMSLSSLSATAAAVEPGEFANRVGLTNLDLTTGGGIEQAYVRVKRVARRQCEQYGVRGLSIEMAVRRCTEQAFARLVGDLNMPALTDYYHVKTGQPIR
jgi:UrcA family protein